MHLSSQRICRFCGTTACWRQQAIVCIGRMLRSMTARLYELNSPLKSVTLQVCEWINHIEYVWKHNTCLYIDIITVPPLRVPYSDQSVGEFFHSHVHPVSFIRSIFPFPLAKLGSKFTHQWLWVECVYWLWTNIQD